MRISDKPLADPLLALALALALAFSVFGITWGRVEGWNPDQMAMRDLRNFLPLSYQKPPVHTYLNHLLVLAPVARLEHLLEALRGDKINLDAARLVGSRLLVVGMFLGTIALAYLLSRDAFGLRAARVIALLFATSAGFIEYDHFLTCDSPLLFFMLLAAFLAWRIQSSGRLGSYLAAGVAVGICTATKYNGLAVGLALVVVHLLATRRSGFLAVAFDRRLLAGLLMVPIGFVIGNPGAVFDSRKFVSDYLYNSKVTPVYGGVASGHGYLHFLARIPEIVGLPGALLLAVAAIFSTVILLRRGDFRSRAAICFAMAASVFCLYFAVIGSFPRIENRFVLPAVPFLILMAGPFLQSSALRDKCLCAVLAPLLCYNAICSLYVGQRFRDDPRSQAQVWVEQHANRPLVLESSAGSPRWTLLPRVSGVEIRPPILDTRTIPDAGVIDWRMPYAFGRLPLFRRIFEHDRWMQEHVAQYELEADETLFTREELRKRNPDVVLVYTYFRIPSDPIRNYYVDLLDGKFPYEIVFDRRTPKPPAWVYPRRIDFLNGRMTILTRRSAGGPNPATP